MSDFFDKRYAMWLDDCIEQFNTTYGRHFGYRSYHNLNVPDNVATLEIVEFSESGDAYVHGIGGIAHIRGAVTPWTDSPHYTD